MNGRCEHEGCQAQAEWRVVVPGEESDVCTAHVGAACSADAVARVIPLGWLDAEGARVIEMRRARTYNLFPFGLMARAA